MGNDVSVRQATVADIDTLAPLFDAYRQFYRQPSDLSLSRQFLLQRLERKESIILLALQQNGSVMGFAQLFPSFSSVAAARIFILNDLFVVPEVRRNGAGRVLLRAAAAFGRVAGAARLTLCTEVTNTAAQALYDAEGWIRQTDFYAYDLPISR
jgi:ribosomal protein S18 acetylase RimI-like enzyme